MWTLVKKTFLWGPVFLGLALVLALLTLPWPIPLIWSQPGTTSFMRYREREARARREELEISHAWVPLEEISPHVVQAVVLAEDGRFREHGGIDWLALAEEVRYDGGRPFSPLQREDLAALARSVRYYWGNRDEVRGRSTITQQLAKNLYFTPDRSLARKAGEFVVARRLERFLSKDRILELYLNTVELGPGLFGVEAAAREYFDTSAGELTPRQAASLAGTLPHPLTSNPAQRPGRMAWRRDRILARMAGGGQDLGPIPVAPEVPEVAVPAAEPTLPGADPREPVPEAPLPEESPVPPPADTPIAPPPDSAFPPDTTRRPDTLGLPQGPGRPGGGGGRSRQRPADRAPHGRAGATAATPGPPSQAR